MLLEEFDEALEFLVGGEFGDELVADHLGVVFLLALLVFVNRRVGVEYHERPFSLILPHDRLMHHHPSRVVFPPTIIPPRIPTAAIIRAVPVPVHVRLVTLLNLLLRGHTPQLLLVIILLLDDATVIPHLLLLILGLLELLRLHVHERGIDGGEEFGDDLEEFLGAGLQAGVAGAGVRGEEGGEREQGVVDAVEQAVQGGFEQGEGVGRGGVY